LGTVGLLCGLAGASGSAWAGSFNLWGIDSSYQLQATYAVATRLESPDDGVINSPGAPTIPLPEYLKVPESNNFDDGDRNFDQWSLVNNRLTLLGELLFQKNDYGMHVRGDAFYDHVYRSENDNNSPDTINKTQGPVNEFSPAASFYSGRRARLLDAYAFATWHFGEEAALNVRAGRQVVAWGESLFFSGIALAQGPADATKATVPGADVKSILLPVNQVSMSLSLTDKWTVVGQYKLDFKEIELNPVGEFFSPADVVGPGREFIWGIQNPLYLSNLSDVNLLSDDVPEALDLIFRLAAPDLPAQQLTDALDNIMDVLNPLLPDLNLPVSAIDLGAAGFPKYINVQYTGDIKPSDHGQWGAGVKYQITPVTNIGLFRLRYHNTTPAPVQNYGYAALGPGITTEAFGLLVPTTYNIKFFDGIDMTALSLSTSLFGANIGAEVIYREGIDVLVDVDGGLLGPVPSPTRADVGSVDINFLYIFNPGPFWDSIVLVGDFGYNYVDNIEPNCGPTSCSTQLSYSKEASAYNFLSYIEKRNVFTGWDIQVPINFAGVIRGHSSHAGAFGSLMGENDKRLGIGVNFTYLQQTTLGLSYSGFIGRPDFTDRPYQDRDNLAFTATYRF
jgi:hypothetical protein